MSPFWGSFLVGLSWGSFLVVLLEVLVLALVPDRMALDGIRMPDGCYADGTWELKMHVTDLHRDVSLRVTGEIHIGGVMLKLVEKLGKNPYHPTTTTWKVLGRSSDPFIVCLCLPCASMVARLCLVLNFEQTVG